MTEAKPSGLYAALARLQKELPRVGKGQTGKVQGENDQGKRYSYEYKYADLADVTAAILPLLGKHGLAFTSRPTLSDGRFVLAYKLTHESGEDERGEYLLPDPQRVKAQTVGSAITYARRYSLCAVTGLAPDSDDDDAQFAQQATERDWHHPPPRPVSQLPRNEDGSLSRSRITDEELDAAGVMTTAQQKEHTALRKGAVTGKSAGKSERVKGSADDDEWTTPVVTDQEWLGRIEDDIRTFADDDAGEVLRRRVVEKTEAGGCAKDDAEKLRTLIRARRQALKVEVTEPAETADA